MLALSVDPEVSVYKAIFWQADKAEQGQCTLIHISWVSFLHTVVMQNHQQLSPQRRHESNCPISNGGFMHLIGREKPEQPKILSEFHKSSLKCLSTKSEKWQTVFSPSICWLSSITTLCWCYGTASQLLWTLFFRHVPKQVNAYGSKCLVFSVWGMQ